METSEIRARLTAIEYKIDYLTKMIMEEEEQEEEKEEKQERRTKIREE